MNADSRIRMLKIVYAWLVKHGTFTTGEWEYYSGNYQPLIDSAKSKKFMTCHIPEEVTLAHIKKVGIDWSKVKEPVDQNQDIFNSTFDDPTPVSTTLGELVLFDGSTVKVGTKGKTLNLEMVATVLEMSELEDYL